MSGVIFSQKPSLEPGGLEDQYVNSAKAFHQLYYHLVKGNITIHQDK